MVKMINSMLYIFNYEKKTDAKRLSKWTKEVINIFLYFTNILMRSFEKFLKDRKQTDELMKKCSKDCRHNK